MMKNILVALAFLCLTMLAGQNESAFAQKVDEYLRRLPKDIKLKEDGPNRYLIAADYFYLDTLGNLTNKERVSGEYTRALPDGMVKWNNVRIAQAKAFDDAFSEGELQKYMEGFSYKHTDKKNMLEKEFFRGFPPTEMKTKNLVWDMHMIEDFAWNYFDKLELNLPYVTQTKPEDVPLAGTGTFQNRKIELTWTGISKRNEKICALIKYEAFFNKLKVAMGNINVQGRSHYWGEIYVSLKDKQIEFATLREDVLVEVLIPGQQAKTLINPFRIITFEKRNN